MLTHQRAKVCLRMDQPLAALQLYSQAAAKHPADLGLLLGQARIQQAVGQHTHALALYQQVGRHALFVGKTDVTPGLHQLCRACSLTVVDARQSTARGRSMAVPRCAPATFQNRGCDTVQA